MRVPKWVAYHEAGHVVAWWILMCGEARPVQVRLVDGHLTGAMLLCERQLSFVADVYACVTAAAGSEADALYSRRSRGLAYLRGGRSDYAEIEASIAHWRLSSDVAERYASAARKLLRCHWARVITVAEALHARGDLSADDVSALLGTWATDHYDTDVMILAGSIAGMQRR